jgi:N-acetylmuramoyl-L-alanine amidase
MMTLTPYEVLVLTLWGEARGEPIEGKVAVASLIRSRLNSGRWGHDYISVCRSPRQFSCWNDDDSQNHQAVMLRATKVMAGQAFSDPAWRECAWVARGVLSGDLQDNVSGAMHYHAASLTLKPKWAIGHQPICQIAGHVFYSGIA